MKSIIITAADVNHSDLVNDFIDSFRKFYADKFKVGFIRLGDIPLKNEIESKFDQVCIEKNGYENFDSKKMVTTLHIAPLRHGCGIYFLATICTVGSMQIVGLVVMNPYLEFF